MVVFSPHAERKTELVAACMGTKQGAACRDLVVKIQAAIGKPVTPAAVAPAP